MNSEHEILGKILYTEADILKRAAELGQEIAKDYAGESVVFLCTLKGSILWMADMMKNTDLEMEIDFISASSYGSSLSSSGIVKIKHDISTDIYKKHVIIIEDIVDTGTTLKYLKEYLKDRNPKSVKVCTLLDKPSGRVADIEADYVGFTVDDLFIIGYGLDYDQKYRNLPYISYLDGDKQQEL